MVSPLMLAGLWIVLTTAAFAQSVQFLACPEVNLLGPACVPREQVVPETPSPPPVPEPPLFALQTMHPSTPPLLIRAYNDPTAANIDAFLDWEDRYLGQALQADALIKARRKQREGQR